MAEYRDEPYGAPLYASFLFALQQFIGTTAPNFHLTLANGTTVQVVAGTNSGQVGAGIDGLWRYISATVNSAVTGAAGAYDVFITTGPNNFTVNSTPPPPEIDATNYSFALQVLLHGTTPTLSGGLTNFRKVGELDWDGTKITGFRPLVGEIDPRAPITPTAPAAAIAPITVVGAASQSADLTRWENNSGTILARVTPTGGLTINGTLTGGGVTVSDNISAGGTLAVAGNTALAALAASGTITSTADITARLALSTAVSIGAVGFGGASGITFQNGEAGSAIYRSGAGAITSPAAWTLSGSSTALTVNHNATISGTLTFTNGTVGLLTVTGGLEGNLASGMVIGNFLVPTDARAAWSIFELGQIGWGAGGSSLQDTNLYRGGVNLLQTDDNFTVGIMLTAANLTVGSVIATANAPSRLGFFGATPVVQPTALNVAAGFTANAGLAVNSTSSFTGNLGSTAYTIGDIVHLLKSLGLAAL